MSFVPSSQKTLFRTEQNINILGSGSPDGKWTIIPNKVRYRHAWMEARFGMHWVDLRRVIAATFVNPSRDSGILNFIKNVIMKLVPVRSGKLLEFILKTMRIKRTKLNQFNARFSALFMYEWPLDRPLSIKNPKHSPPSEGYGEWGTVTLTHNIPNVRVIRVTPSGNALYSLNDPFALGQPQRFIQDIGSDELMRDFTNVFEGLVLQYRL